MTIKDSKYVKNYSVNLLHIILNKVTGYFEEKKRLWHRCFPVNFAKFLRTSFSQNTSGSCFCNFQFQRLLGSLWERESQSLQMSMDGLCRLTASPQNKNTKYKVTSLRTPLKLQIISTRTMEL